MGYTNIFPFQMLTYNFTLSNDDLILSTVHTDGGIATITTPKWSFTPSYAFLSLVCGMRINSNAADNFIDTGHLALTVDDVVFQECGDWRQFDVFTKGSTYAYGTYRILGNTNIASYIQPSTAYTVYAQDYSSGFDSLQLRNLSLELNMVFNV